MLKMDSSDKDKYSKQQSMVTTQNTLTLSSKWRWLETATGDEPQYKAILTEMYRLINREQHMPCGMDASTVHSNVVQPKFEY